MHGRETNRCWRRGLVFAVAGCLAGNAARGQGPARPALLPPVAHVASSAVESSLTLAALEHLALTHNPTIPAAEALVRQHQGQARQAGLYPNPTLGYLRNDPDQPNQSASQGIFLGQEFVTAGKLKLAREATQLEVEHSDWQLQAQRARVLNDVRIRYYEVLGAQEAANAARELETLAEEGVKVAQQLLDAQQGSRPDLLQAEMQRSAVRSALQDALYRLEASWRQLVSVAGVPDLHAAPLAERLDDRLPSLEWHETLQTLLAASPLLRSQEAEVRATEVEVRLARAQAIPNLSVQVVAQRDRVQKYTTVSTLVALPIPLFNRNQGNIVTAEGLHVQQQREYDRIRLALTDQLAASFRQYRSLRGQADRLRQDILPRSKENLDLTTRAYQAGQFDFPRVLAARQTYFQTRLAYIDTLTELHKAVIEINGLQLTGGLNPTEVGTALQGQQGAGGAGLRGVLSQQAAEQRGGVSRNLPGAIQAGER